MLTVLHIAGLVLVSLGVIAALVLILITITAALVARNYPEE